MTKLLKSNSVVGGGNLNDGPDFAASCSVTLSKDFTSLGLVLLSVKHSSLPRLHLCYIHERKGCINKMRTVKQF